MSSVSRLSEFAGDGHGLWRGRKRIAIDIRRCDRHRAALEDIARRHRVGTACRQDVLGLAERIVAASNPFQGAAPCVLNAESHFVCGAHTERE